MNTTEEKESKLVCACGSKSFMEVENRNENGELISKSKMCVFCLKSVICVKFKTE